MSIFRITAGNKEHFDSLIKDFRNDGYMLITYGDRLAELEKDDSLVIIEF